MLADALAFHATILDHANTPAPADYGAFALKGIAQPTTTSVRKQDGQLEALNTLEGNDWWGDGTVPRISSHFPEWKDDSYAGTFGQQHATLQSDSNLHRQLFAILTANQIETYADAEKLLGLELPEVVQAGEPLPVKVVSRTGDHKLPLRVHLLDEAGQEIDSCLMGNLGDGRYEAKFDDTVPGQVSVRIVSASPSVPLDTVTGVSLVWEATAAGED